MLLGEDYSLDAKREERDANRLPMLVPPAPGTIQAVAHCGRQRKSKGRGSQWGLGVRKGNSHQSRGHWILTVRAMLGPLTAQGCEESSTLYSYHRVNRTVHLLGCYPGHADIVFI